MATEPDKGKGKENENEIDPVKQSTPWTGRLQDGKWFCDCNRRARCFTVTKVSSPNHGKKFWTCPKARNDQCAFFIWVEGEEEAKEWHLKYGPPPLAPETPKSNEKSAEDVALPKSLRTPWTIAKRKPVSIEVSDEDENGGPSNRSSDGDELPEFEDIDSPSRKMPKITRFSTPGKTFGEGTKNAAASLPTPDTGNQPVGVATSSRSRLPNRTSPPPQLEHAIILNNERESNLTAAVIKLIRSEGIEMKESTEIQIRHEIDMELRLNETKERSYKGTISKLSARLDQLENMVRLLGGDVGADDAVELSE